MEIIYITIPLVLIVGSLVVAMFIWMAKKGQFDDLDGAGHRILFDDEGPQETKTTKEKALESQQSTDKPKTDMT
ncbi:cbb3-type cytochrome oxidase assembly protein CcoS [Thiomicrospira microaerophila]|uniref:cbb3-type cytochrome oxidase assembly protein CcoS n=1 Tax=Thiomicrospira microaerophila TaxID=406020 RepID=UPI0005C9C58B|nr:cbb3-type cytochrome oxidase assembly protein CcoS [Thiomicrospira microaerophila]